MTALLGLDLGTSHVRAVAYDPERGAVVGQAARPTPVEHPWVGASQHDPQALWEAVAACIREVVTRLAGQRVAGLAIASFAEAGLPLDAAGQPLYPIIAWYDRRCEPQVAFWENRYTPGQLHTITGQRVSPSFGVNKWLWIRDHHPELAARAASWLSAPDYILYRLSGERFTDYSLASRTLLFDQRSLGWSGELLAQAGLSAGQLPCPRPGGTPIGTVTSPAAAETGLPAGTPCVLGGHDHLVAGLAAGAFRPGVVVDSSGTAQALQIILPAFVTNSRLAEGGYACYAHVLAGQYVLKGGLKAAGGAVEWLARQLSGLPAGERELPYAELMAEAQAGVGRRAGPLWLPHLIGSGTPQGDRYSRGALVGVTVEQERGDVFRGMLEGLAFWLRHNLAEMAQLTGQAIEQVVLLGGTTRLSLLTQLKADVLGLPVVVPDLAQAAGVGAALLAGVGVGLYAGPAEAVASLRCARQVVSPNPARVEWYTRLYEAAYLPLYAALRDVHHAMEQIRTTTVREW
jgi:xylulokinase